MHPLVTTQVGELSVCFQTDLALEGLDAAVNVLVLLQAARCCKRLPALRARVAPGPNVLRPDVPLEIAWVCEHLVTVLARKRFAVLLQSK